MKHKSNTGGLMNFINKANQTNLKPKAEPSKKPNQNLDPKIQNSLNPSSNLGPKEKRNSEITSFKTFPKKTDSSFFSYDKLILPSQNIEDSILNELPEDIRQEILASKNLQSKGENPNKKNTQSSSKSIQNKQESYFKEKKPNIPKGKAKLPPMQEIDMAVLVELPEDIRNEILNEYKTNSENSSDSSTLKIENTFDPKAAIQSDKNLEIKPDQKVEVKDDKSNPHLNHLTDEKYFSFSQVDPEFLAALPEDMRDDVQMYCMMKKRERNNAEKKKAESKKPNKISNGWSMFKQSTSSKTTKPKSTRGRKPKSVLGRNNGVATRVKEVEREKNKLEIIKQTNKEVNKEANKQAETKVIEEKEMIEIISHIRCFPVESVKSGGQEKALSSLVKCMFDLSVDQVRILNEIGNSILCNIYKFYFC